MIPYYMSLSIIPKKLIVSKYFFGIHQYFCHDS